MSYRLLATVGVIPLHDWHKLFWDHDVKWCSNALGADEMDFLILNFAHVGFHQFKEGVSRLKQVIGREHHVGMLKIILWESLQVPDKFVTAM